MGFECGSFFGHAILVMENFWTCDLVLVEHFWDTTFHFPGIGEVVLTPYDYSIITGLKLGGERILVNDSLTSTELNKLLGVVPSRMKSNNITLS